MTARRIMETRSLPDTWRYHVRILLAAITLVLCLPALAANDIDAKVKAALAADARPQADRDRDDNRLPLQTLQFFGLKDDMRVLELIPGGGWYTRVLAPVLADSGKLYVALGTSRVSRGVLTEPGFEKVEVIDTSDNLRRPKGSLWWTKASIRRCIRSAHSRYLSWPSPRACLPAGVADD